MPYNEIILMNGLEIRICLVVNYNLVNKIAKLATLLLKSRVYCNILQTTPHQLLIFLNFIKNINIYLYTYTNRQTKSHKIVVIVIQKTKNVELIRPIQHFYFKGFYIIYRKSIVYCLIQFIIKSHRHQIHHLPYHHQTNLNL